jgi:hypothetical protein
MYTGDAAAFVESHRGSATPNVEEKLLSRSSMDASIEGKSRTAGGLCKNAGWKETLYGE